MTPDTFPSLFWSYTVIWVVLVAYIVTLGARISRIEKKMKGDQSSCCERTSCAN